MKTITRVRRNGGSKTTSPQAPNNPESTPQANADTFVVEITDEIKESAKEAGETVKQFIATAIRHKLETNADPLHRFFDLGANAGKNLYVDRDGRLFTWNASEERKPEEVSLAEAISWWRIFGAPKRYFEDYLYMEESPAYEFMSLLKHHWRAVEAAEQRRV